jgi:hypothetical protein
MAVGRDHKLANGKAVSGSVGHDRIQQARADCSIGESIRRWYSLKTGVDFERIDVDVTIHKDGHFILTPTAVFMRGGKKRLVLEKIHSPLSFHRDYASKFWKKQIDLVRAFDATILPWAQEQIFRVVKDHKSQDLDSIHEADLVRTSGALSKLGLQLGAYHIKGYDCPRSTFHFNGLPVYPCAVEVKKLSSGFNYQITKYTNLPRVVVLCIEHDLVNPPDHVDVVELSTLAKYLLN